MLPAGPVGSSYEKLYGLSVLPLDGWLKMCRSYPGDRFATNTMLSCTAVCYDIAQSPVGFSFAVKLMRSYDPILILSIAVATSAVLKRTALPILK